MMWIIVIIILGLIVYGFSRVGRSRITMEEIREGLATGGQLIDVRTPAEFKTRHAKGAKNVSLQSLQSGSSIGGDKQKPVFVYCHSGARARMAVMVLKQQGYQAVKTIGGLSTWERLGGDTTQ